MIGFEVVINGKVYQPVPEGSYPYPQAGDFILVKCDKRSTGNYGNWFAHEVIGSHNFRGEHGVVVTYKVDESWRSTQDQGCYIPLAEVPNQSATKKDGDSV